jgi:hypothetical protein
MLTWGRVGVLCNRVIVYREQAHSYRGMHFKL